jgi:cytidyltransferase-like protein
MEENKKEKAIIVSGYFNPLHKGHLEYFERSKKLGDKLFIIVNNDNQRLLKGSKEFMLEDERMLIIESLSISDFTLLSIDQDKTVRNTLEFIYNKYNNKYQFYFANGGDQLIDNIPELKICQSLGINLIDGLGKKIQSSSWLLNKE